MQEQEALQKQFAELEAEERVIGIPEVLRGSMQEYYNEGGEPFMREQQEASLKTGYIPPADWSDEKKMLLKRAEAQKRELFEENLRLRKELEMSSGPVVSQWEREREEWRKKCAALIQQKDSLIDQIERDRANWRNEKRFLVEQRAQEEVKVEEHRARRVADWEREKEQLLARIEQERSVWERAKRDFASSQESLTSEKDFVAKERQRLMKALQTGQTQWEIDKDKILANWAEETEILTMIWREDKEKWGQEKSRMLQELAQQRDIFHKKYEATIRELESSIQDYQLRCEQMREDLMEMENEIIQFRNSSDAHESEASAARIALDDLRDSLIQIAEGDSELATMIISAATDRAMERTKVEKLEGQNQALLNRLREETRLRKTLHNQIEDIKGHIRVVVRQRPPLSFEIQRRVPVDDDTVEVSDDTSILVNTASTGYRKFEFYRCLDDSKTQEHVYEEVQPLIQSAIDGYNVCIMAYGQTGSGKTYTIYGEDRYTRGVVFRAVEDLFNLLAAAQSADNVRFSVRCSMVELYVDQFRDLLAESAPAPTAASKGSLKLEVKQSPVFGTIVQNAIMKHASSAEEILGMMDRGTRLRQVHATQVNPQSSRSHTVFTLYLDVRHLREQTVTKSKLTFVDLAGSERISKSGSTGVRLKEAQHINKSLSALGDVVAALSCGDPHTPYRNSKLTTMLQDTLGGNSKTLMFLNIFPSGFNTSESMSTLQFGSRVKQVRNPFVRNKASVDPGRGSGSGSLGSSSRPREISDESSAQSQAGTSGQQWRR